MTVDARKSTREAALKAAKDAGVLDEAAPLLEADAGLGSPAYFGRALKTVRVVGHNVSLSVWAAKLGLDDAKLSRIERGANPIPARNELLVWGKLLKLNPEEIDNILMAAAYLPETGFETGISGEEFPVVVGAVREALGRTPPQRNWSSLLTNLRRLRASAGYLAARGAESSGGN